MKAYRQNAGRERRGATRRTLRELADMEPLREVQLVCNQELRVVVEKERGRFGNARKRNRPVRIEIVAGQGRTSLMQCFEMVEQGSQDQYILVGGMMIAQDRYRPFSTPNQAVSQKYPKGNFARKITQQNPSLQFIEQSHSSDTDYFNEQVGTQQPMSVVEEIANESNHSQCNESQNSLPLNQIPQSDIGDIKAKYLQQALCKEENEDEEAPCPVLAEQQEKGGKEERFSFTKRMEKGMIQMKSLQMEKKSLKLSAQQEIEQAKEESKPNLPAQAIESLGMNSILSLDPTPKETSPPLKTEVLQQSKRVQLSLMAKQHQELSQDVVQITEKTIEPNRSEFYVRYNFRFLEKKANPTEVMRVSPLKFRKIEGTTRHLPPPSC